MTEMPNPIMPVLKEATASQHDATEQNSFNALLTAGKLPREAFVETLAQFFLVHRAYEDRLREAGKSIPYSIPDHEFQVPYLREDLAFLGRDLNDISPVPATTAFIEFVNAIPTNGDDAVGLLGAHYVFEGSNNGSKFFARNIRAAYGLNESDGTRYLDPYGQKQAKNWKAFKDGMNSVEFNEAQREALKNAATRTFDAVAEIHRDLGKKFATATK